MENFEIIRYALIFIGIALVLLVLFISYKTDKNQSDEISDDDTENEDYDDIQTDEEQSLYSSFNEEELKKEEIELSNFESEPEKTILDNEKETPIVEEVPSDFEFDDIFNEPLKNNILTDDYDSEFEEPIKENEEFSEVSTLKEYEKNTEDFWENQENKIDILAEIEENNKSNSYEEIQEPVLEETDTFFTQIEENVENIPEIQSENVYEEPVVEFFTTSEDDAETIATKEENTEETKTSKKSTTRKNTKKSEEEKKTTKKTAAKKTTTKKTTTKKTTKKSDDKEEKPAKKTTAKKTTAKKTTTKKTTKKSEEKNEEEAPVKKRTTRKKKDE